MWFARRLAGSESVWGVLVTGKSLIGFSLLSFHGFQIFFGGFWVKGLGQKKSAGYYVSGAVMDT